MMDHVKTKPPAPSEVSELPVPPELDAIVLRCLEKSPDDRFASVRELRRALEALPLDEPWTEEKAEAWWKLHMSSDEIVKDCFCPPVEDLSRDDVDRSGLAFETVRG